MTSLCLSSPLSRKTRGLDSDIKVHLAIKACDPLPVLTKENPSSAKLQLFLSPSKPSPVQGISQLHLYQILSPGLKGRYNWLSCYRRGEGGSRRPSGLPEVTQRIRAQLLRTPSLALLSPIWLGTEGKICAGSDSSEFKFKGDSSNEQKGERHQGCPFQISNMGTLLAGPKI